MAISLAHKAITVDINSRNAPNLVAIANVNDKATRYLDVTLTASGKKLSFAGCTATATFVTEGILISDEVACTLNSAADVITVPLDNLKSTAGFLSIEIKIKNGETQVLNTPLALKVQITPSLTDGSKINKDSVGTTAEICREVAAARGNYADLNTRITADETNLETVKSEITAARDTFDNLGERLDNLLPNEVDVITTDHMRDGSVKTNKIADATVTASKLSRDLLTLINSVVNKANTADVEKLLALKANTSDVDTALAKKASTTEVNELLALKSDKATTLAGYGITDAYTKAMVKSLLAGKLDAMSFDNEPTLNSPCYLTSGTVYSALAKKFDNSNIETGKGNLAPAQAIYDGYEGSFNYVKIGKIVTVALNITTLIAGKNYVQFSGLPYTALTASRLSSIVAYTTANKLVNLRLDGSWLYISSPDTTFADGEKINAIITYIIG